MKLALLKQRVDEALSKLGDIDVIILVTKQEDCNECGESKERKFESENVRAYTTGCPSGYNFWIEGIQT